MIILRCGGPDASTIQLYDGQTNIVNSESCARTHAPNTDYAVEEAAGFVSSVSLLHGCYCCF